MLDLRPYQESCVRAVLSARERLQRSLYVLPTGCGKTVTFCEIIRRIRQDDDRPALILAHREELLEQASSTVRRLIPGITVEIERGPSVASRFAEVIVASIPTVARAGTLRLDWLADIKPSVIIYDEAHHAAADGAGRALKRFGAFDGGTYLVGCTATPHRLDNKPLEGAEGQATFQETVYRYSLLDAIKDGWLCDMRGFVVRSGTDLSGITTRGGDFAEGELARCVNNDARTALAAKHWKELASDRPTIVFCASVEHAEAAIAHWEAVGARAEVLHGGMSSDDRRAVLDRFRRGVTQVLTNCQIATEGFDHPPVSCVVMLRPTKSWSLYAQMAGRGTRLFSGKADCLILDVVDNCDHHSLVTAPRLMDLPAGVDLAGKGLREAREELDALGARAAHLPDQPGLWSDLVSKALEVPLFAVPQTPKEIEAAGRMRWIYIPGQGYLCDCGNNPGITERRQCWVREAPLGFEIEMRWQSPVPGHAYKKLPFRETVSVKDSLPDAIRFAEGYIRSWWPDCMRVTQRGASWGAKAPTEAQVKLALKLARQAKIAGFDPSTIQTSAEMSRTITMLSEMAKTHARPTSTAGGLL